MTEFACSVESHQITTANARSHICHLYAKVSWFNMHQQPALCDSAEWFMFYSIHSFIHLNSATSILRLAKRLLSLQFVVFSISKQASRFICYTGSEYSSLQLMWACCLCPQIDTLEGIFNDIGRMYFFIPPVCGF